MKILKCKEIQRNSELMTLFQSQFITLLYNYKYSEITYIEN